MPHAVQPRCLTFDLETVPAHENEAERIVKVGALRPDTGDSFEAATSKQLAPSLVRLDRMCEGASFILGHNIVAHDLPILAAAAPASPLLERPAIDTLRLSPLAFPQNPYHRLIKDYKLIRDSLNS